MSRVVTTASLRRHALRWRALSTSTDPSLNPLADELPPLSPTGAGRERGGVQHNVNPRMIFVRPWDGIPTMAHAFAIVRDIERRFGRIQEFVIIRDTDVLSSCSPFLHATFSREEDANAIPLDGKVIQVVEPDVDREREGGIGLDDLDVYINPETRDRALFDSESTPEKEPEGGPPEGKVMDVKLERTTFRDPPPVLDQSFGFGRRGPPHVNNPIRTQELAHAIRAFGGFVDQPQGSKTRMATVVSRWSRMVRQPSQPPPDSTQENIVDEPPPEKPEEPALPEGFQRTPWTSFETKSEAPPPFSSSDPITPLTPIPPSPPVGPSIPSSQSKPTLEANNDKHTPKPDSIPKLPSKPKPHVIPAEPKISRKQRMLNAARLAGAMAAEKPPDLSEHPQATSHVPDASAGQTAEFGHDPTPSAEKNKAAARRWWNFLTGSN